MSSAAAHSNLAPSGAFRGRMVRTLAAIDAALLLILAYWIEFGGGLVSSYRDAKTAAENSQDPSGNLTTAQMAQWLVYWGVLILLALIAITIAMWLIGRERIREWLIGRRPATPGGGLLTVGVVWVTLKIPVMAYLVMGMPGTWVSTAPWWYEVGSGTLAGIGEELVVVAAPLVLTRFVLRDPKRRFPPVGVWLLLIAARLAYHLYYGVWPALISFTLWAAATVWVYWLVGRVWPLVLAHLCIYLPNAFRIPYGIQSMALLALGVVFVIVGTMRWRRAKRAAPRRAALEPAPATSIPAEQGHAA